MRRIGAGTLRRRCAAAGPGHGWRSSATGSEHRRRGIAWTSVSGGSGAAGRRTRVQREAVLLPSDRTTPSSVAVACSSKSKLTQKRFAQRQAQARLMRPPNGVCRTSCMPRPRRRTVRRRRVHVGTTRGRRRSPRCSPRSGPPASSTRDSSTSQAGQRRSLRRAATPARRSDTAGTARPCGRGLAEQNGSEEGAPSHPHPDLPRLTRRMRHEVFPRRKMSPAMLSMAKSRSPCRRRPHPARR